MSTGCASPSLSDLNVESGGKVGDKDEACQSAGELGKREPDVRTAQASLISLLAEREQKASPVNPSKVPLSVREDEKME